MSLNYKIALNYKISRKPNGIRGIPGSIPGHEGHQKPGCGHSQFIPIPSWRWNFCTSPL